MYTHVLVYPLFTVPTILYSKNIYIYIYIYIPTIHSSSSTSLLAGIAAANGHLAAHACAAGSSNHTRRCVGCENIYVYIYIPITHPKTLLLAGTAAKGASSKHSSRCVGCENIQKKICIYIYIYIYTHHPH